MRVKKIASIIVSAGYSSRMGSFKPFLKFGEKSAIEIVVDTHKKAGINDIIVITGYRGSEVTEKLKDTGIHCIQNENFERGMFSSVVKGVKALDTDVEAFFMQPVDIPLIKSYTIQNLKEEYLKNDIGIIYPEFGGKPGHPPLIDIKYRENILKSSGEGGLKKVLGEYSGDSMYVPVFDKAISMDMDTKEDYDELLRYFNAEAPDIDECYSILDMFKVPDNIKRHCAKVSMLCFKILYDLKESGCSINENTLEAAAMLHDIAKMERNHAEAGAILLKEMGYEKVGSIIGSHNDIEVNEDADISENEILFLADKLVKEDKIVSIEKRFKEPLDKFCDKPDVIANILKRRDTAYKIIHKIERITGKGFLWTE